MQPLYPDTTNREWLEKNFHQYYNALCTLASRMINDPVRAEDIVQDVFIRLWEHQKFSTPDRPVRTLLYVSVRNAAYDYLAAMKTTTNRQQQYKDWSVSGESTWEEEEQILKVEMIRQAYEAMENLPEQCRNVMRLYFDEGLSLGDIARALNIHISTVKTHKKRGLDYLRGLLGIFTPLCLLLSGL